MNIKALDPLLNKGVQMYYWYSTGTVVMPVISFALLCITASTNIQLYLKGYIDVPTAPLVATMVLCGFSGVFILGWFLDIILRYPHRQLKVANQRNQMLMDIDERTRKIEEALEAMKK